MKILNEIKANIFAQYPNVKVEYAGSSSELLGVIWDSTETFLLRQSEGLRFSEYFKDNPDAVLLLKPLSAITDEDAIEVANILHRGRNQNAWEISRANFPTIWVKNELDWYQDFCFDESNIEVEIGQIDIYLVLHAYQYLQTRGYALPYMEYTVEQLVEAGIYKLITE